MLSLLVRFFARKGLHLLTEPRTQPPPRCRGRQLQCCAAAQRADSGRAGRRHESDRCLPTLLRTAYAGHRRGSRARQPEPGGRGRPRHGLRRGRGDQRRRHPIQLPARARLVAGGRRSRAARRPWPGRGGRTANAYPAAHGLSAAARRGTALHWLAPRGQAGQRPRADLGRSGDHFSAHAWHRSSRSSSKTVGR